MLFHCIGHPIALEVKHWVLEESEMSSTVAPVARNGHEVGGKFLFEDFE